MNGKRSAEELETNEKRTRIKLASPSPVRTSGSDTESIHSCQGYKTEIANDTSDTSSSQLPIPSLEYEVIHPESQKFKFYFSDDSTEDEDEFKGLINFILATSNDSLDNALLGDTSEENSTSPTSNSDVDPGLPRNDYLDFEKCLLCKTDKKDISYPYCSSCFTWRKKLFPDRPKKRKIDYKRPVRHHWLLNKSNFSSVSPNKNKGVCLEKKSTNGNLSDGLFEDSGVGSTEQNLSEDTVDGPSQPSTSSSNSTTNFSKLKDSDVCRVCFLKSENGLFVHSNSAHLYGCYNCAKEIWYHNGGCPICRRKVFKVVKLYV